MTSPSCSCPACNSAMVRENFGIVLVDVCVDGCRGIWFDGDELSRLDSERKGGGPALQRSLKPAESAPAVSCSERPWSCPKCAVELDVLEYELEVTVAIDSCPECTGVFLEAGELAQIRSRPPTEEELLQARLSKRRRGGFRRRRLEREQRMRGIHAVACSTSFM